MDISKRGNPLKNDKMTTLEMNTAINNRVKQIVLTEASLMEQIKDKTQKEQKDIVYNLALYTLLYGNN